MVKYRDSRRLNALAQLTGEWVRVLPKDEATVVNCLGTSAS